MHFGPFNFPSIKFPTISQLLFFSCLFSQFDTQTCSFTFQGWNYAYDEMLIQADDPSYVAQSSALYSPEWVIMSISTQEQVATFDGDYYSCQTFIIQATRRPYFYIMNVMLPCGL